MPSKTTFSNKCAILGDLWMWHRHTDNEEWEDFFSWGDVGLPLAYFVSKDFATAKDAGKDSINEVWDSFCQMIDIDPDGKYENLSEAFEASPNPVLDE